MGIRDCVARIALSRVILIAQIAAISRVHAGLYEPAGVGIIWSFN
jgi:hypothetical protein